MRRHQVPLDQLKELHLFRSLLEPQAAATGERRYFAADFYGALERFRTYEVRVSTQPELKQKGRKTQLAGTCSLRCFLAYGKLFFENDPKQYKEIKGLLSGYVVQMGVELNRLLFQWQPQLSKLLSLASPHLFHAYSKRLSAASVDLQKEQQQLKELTDIKTSLQAAIPKPFSENKKIPNAESYPTQAFGQTDWLSIAAEAISSISDRLSGLAAWFKRKAEPPILPLPMVTLSQIDTPAALESYLQEVDAFLSTQTDPAFIKHCITSILCTLGRSFLAPTSTSPLSLLVASLKQDADASERLLAQIDRLAIGVNRADTNQIRQQRANYGSNLSSYVARLYALVMGRELAMNIETLRNYPEGGRIQDYGFDISTKRLDKDALRTHMMFNPEIEEDLQNVINYAKQCRRENEKNLFDFTAQLKQDCGFTLKSRGTSGYAPEFHYAQVHARSAGKLGRSGQGLSSQD